jgi:hypothetical protein
MLLSHIHPVTGLPRNAAFGTRSCWATQTRLCAEKKSVILGCSSGGEGGMN